MYKKNKNFRDVLSFLRHVQAVKLNTYYGHEVLSFSNTRVTKDILQVSWVNKSLYGHYSAAAC
jgi:hypothetical protein